MIAVVGGALALAMGAPALTPDQAKLFLHCTGTTPAGRRVEHSIVIYPGPDPAFATVNESPYRSLRDDAYFRLEGGGGLMPPPYARPITIIIDRLSGSYSLAFDPEGIMVGAPEVGTCEKASKRF